MRLHIQDAESGESLTGARCVFEFLREGQGQKIQDISDAQGDIEIATPEKSQGLKLIVAKAGYVPAQMAWHELNDEIVPSECSIKLERGCSIGGTVVNDEDRPVAGAQILLNYFGNRFNPGKFHQPEYRVDSEADGRWVCDFAPGRIEDIVICASHADYVTAEFSVKPGRSGLNFSYLPLDEKALRSGSEVLKLDRGICYGGTVTNRAGSAVANAIVRLGNESEGKLLTTETDDQGRFAFKHCAPEPMMVVVEAEGYSPKGIPVNPHQPRIRFTLDPETIFEGKVENENGEAVAGAKIHHHWHAIAPPPHRLSLSLQWSSESDVEGCFAIRWTTSSHSDVSIFKQGYQRLSIRGRVPEAGKPLILTKSPRIYGTVRDAETKEPIEGFRLSTTMAPLDPQFFEHWLETRRAAGSDYSFQLVDTRNYLFKIEADGYLPYRSEPLQAASDLKRDVELTRARKWSGIVEGPDGKPLAGAQVVVAGEREAWIVHQTTFRRFGPKQTPKPILTNNDGRFEIEEVPDGLTVGAIHEQGYCEMAFDELMRSGRIRLQAWAQVNGTYRRSHGAGAGQALGLTIHGYRIPFNANAFSVRTDEEGRFHFDHVPPGTHSICWYRRDGNEPWSDANLGSVSVSAGEILCTEIGGRGKTLLGRVKADPDYPVQWSSGQHSLFQWTVVQGPASSINPRTVSVIKANRRMPGPPQARHYPVEFSSDGSFRIYDVMPGDYRLSLRFSVPETGLPGEFGRTIGSLDVAVTVNPTESKNSNESVYLGTYVVALSNHLQIGDKAPDLDAKTVTGTPISLRQLRGRYVVLTFSPAYPEIRHATLVDLRHLAEEFGEYGGLAILDILLGLNVESEVLHPLAQAEKLGWYQIHGRAMESSVATSPDAGYEILRRYGLASLSHSFLIDPDGRIVGQAGRPLDLHVPDSVRRRMKREG